MDNSNIYNELIAFIQEQSGAYDIEITRDTLIEDGLGVTGDDGDDLIIAFAKKFNVDVSNINPAKYFHDEPGLFMWHRKIEPLTVGDLERAVIHGRLDDDIIRNYQ